MRPSSSVTIGAASSHPARILRQPGGRNTTKGGLAADDVINAQDRHLKEAEKAGDASHEARNAMKGRWRHPKKSLNWYRDMKTTFAGLPEG